MYIDDKSEFSTFKPSPIVSLIIEITRSVGDSWIAKRIIFILRRFAILLSKDCIDTELFNAKIRLYTKGNMPLVKTKRLLSQVKRLSFNI